MPVSLTASMTYFPGVEGLVMLAEGFIQVDGIESRG